MRLVNITPSTKAGKKYMAVFDNEGRKKTVHFGSAGMDDYLHTHDKEQRERYRTRHKKDLRTRDPTRAGFLSYYILWGDSTSFHQNVTDYKRRFGL
jgi:hypothetical protein